MSYSFPILISRRSDIPLISLLYQARRTRLADYPFQSTCVSQEYLTTLSLTTFLLTTIMHYIHMHIVPKLARTYLSSRLLLYTHHSTALYFITSRHIDHPPSKPTIIGLSSQINYSDRQDVQAWVPAGEPSASERQLQPPTWAWIYTFVAVLASYLHYLTTYRHKHALIVSTTAALFGKS